MIEVGIIGSAGYTAGELIRILIHHPQVHINFAYSTSNAGNRVSSVHQDLEGNCELTFTNIINPNVNVIFLCLGHGNSKTFLEQHLFANHTKIIDLSNDFRLQDNKIFQGKEFVYGLPEIFKNKIQNANYIANPGCFATAIQLALLPLAKAHLLKKDIHIQAVTGSTGAGVSLSKTAHFSWRDNNFSYYKPFTHQHLSEINQTIALFSPEYRKDVLFMPYRGNFSRGIFVTAYTQYKGTLEDAQELYNTFYKDAAFTFVSDNLLHLKQVVNTNKCLIHLHKHKNTLLITSCIDNLVKGASGQAIQNMNIQFGLPEDTGLQLKGTFF